MREGKAKGAVKMDAGSWKKRINKRKWAIWILLVLGFGATEFPGILFVGDKIYPRIFGLPFLYGYILCCWLFIFCVLVYAYRTKWGKAPFFIARPPR
jgi:hypothetical protein